MSSFGVTSARTSIAAAIAPSEGSSAVRSFAKSLGSVMCFCSMKRLTLGALVTLGARQGFCYRSRAGVAREVVADRCTEAPRCRILPVMV